MADAPFDQENKIDFWAMEIINHAREQIHVVDQSGRILYSNQYGGQHGKSLSLDGQIIYDLVLPEYLDLVRGVLNTVLTSGVTGSFESAFS